MARTPYNPEYATDLLLVSLAPEEFGEAEVDGMILLNQSSNDWFNGIVETEVYFDTLRQFNLEPEEHLAPLLSYLGDFLP